MDGDGDGEELQPESWMKPMVSSSASNEACIRRLFSRKVRRGERARQMRAAQAVPATGMENGCRWAVVVAVVVTVRVVNTAVDNTEVDDGIASWVEPKIQVTPVGRVPHESLTVPV